MLILFSFLCEKHIALIVYGSHHLTSVAILFEHTTHMMAGGSKGINISIATVISTKFPALHCFVLCMLGSVVQKCE